MANDLRVLFIVGKGRSGSTILGDVLGSLQGVFHAGELWRLWSGGLAESYSCSCGAPVLLCDVWAPILDLFAEDALGAWTLDNRSEFIELQRQIFTFGGLARPIALRRARRDLNDRYRRIMAVLYSAISTVTDSQLIVDSSKWPLDPSLLVQPDRITTKGVHLVRDPCDVARSWNRTKYFPDTGEPMPQFSSLHTVASWSARNLAAEWAHVQIGDRMLRLRYEDFAHEPRRAVDSIRRHARLNADLDEVFSGTSTVNLKANHTIMGNPSRFQRGPVTISLESSSCNNRIVRGLTYVLRRRYGYVSTP